MPELVEHVIQNHQADAVEAVHEAMRALDAHRLTPSELSGYALRSAIAGWRLHVEFPDKVRRVDALVDKHFPRSQVRIALVDRPSFLTWAHVEKDGLLCLLGGAATVSPYSPADAALSLLGEACHLIEDLIADRLTDDLRDEFASYWDWSLDSGATQVLSLVTPLGPSRPVRVWRGRRHYILAENDETLAAWLEAEHGKARNDLKFEPAALVWLDRPLLPAEYPQSGANLLAVAAPGGADVLKPMLAKNPEQLVVALGAMSPLGACFGCVTLHAPVASARKGGRRILPIEAGFRPGHTPPELLVRRFLNGAIVLKSSVERVDASWVHGRDQDNRQPLLSGTTVTVLGCGSIGAAIAVMLAQSGVGRLRLVDFDWLKASNVGRHPLGMRDLRKNKAEALAAYIREHFPHIKTEGYATAWQTLDDDFGLFSQSSLIVSAMGDWASEGALNAAHLGDGSRVPIVYGWTEAHAAAGHAVLVDGTGGCLQCGLDNHGASLFPATIWPVGGDLKREPACGGVFQPYGPAELSFIVALISELVMDALLGSDTSDGHRIWVAERLVTSVGGELSSELKSEVPTRPSLGFIHTRGWELRESCPECQARKAAV